MACHRIPGSASISHSTSIIATTLTLVAAEALHRVLFQPGIDAHRAADRPKRPPEWASSTRPVIDKSARGRALEPSLESVPEDSLITSPRLPAGRERWLGEDCCGAPPLRIVPTHPASSRSGGCTRGCARSCSSVSSIAEPAKTPTKCGGGGIRTHGSLAAPAVFKMAVGLREP